MRSRSVYSVKPFKSNFEFDTFDLEELQNRWSCSEQF